MSTNAHNHPAFHCISSQKRVDDLLDILNFSTTRVLHYSHGLLIRRIYTQLGAIRSRVRQDAIFRGVGVVVCQWLRRGVLDQFCVCLEAIMIDNRFTAQLHIERCGRRQN
jgi:hypothetical protein